MSILIYHGPPGSYKTSSAIQEQLIKAVKEGTWVPADSEQGKRFAHLKTKRQNQNIDPDSRIGKQFAASGYPVTNVNGVDCLVIPFINVPRPIVTNVRGVCIERIKSYFENSLPDDWLDGIEVIHVNTDGQEGRDRLARWFHWVPLGAFLIIDEAQAIFPKRWKDADLLALDFPIVEPHKTVRDSAGAAGRPGNFLEAWDMHRHYNWDIVLTTPKIEKIRDDIRGAAEGAYHHKNLAVLGWMFKGKYSQAFHMASDSPGPSSCITIESKRINKRTFRLYDSTSTGFHSDTKAGTSIFKDPKILVLLALAVLPFIYVGFTGIPFLTRKPSAEKADSTAVHVPGADNKVPAGGGKVATQTGHDSGVYVSGGPGSAPAVAVDHPLAGVRLSIIGVISNAKRTLITYSAATPGGNFQIDSERLKLLGYTISMVSECYHSVTYRSVQASRVYASCFNQLPTGSTLAAAPKPANSDMAPNASMPDQVIMLGGTEPKSLDPRHYPVPEYQPIPFNGGKS